MEVEDAGAEPPAPPAPMPAPRTVTPPPQPRSAGAPQERTRSRGSDNLHRAAFLRASSPPRAGLITDSTCTCSARGVDLGAEQRGLARHLPARHLARVAIEDRPRARRSPRGAPPAPRPAAKARPGAAPARPAARRRGLARRPGRGPPAFSALAVGAGRSRDAGPAVRTRDGADPPPAPAGARRGPRASQAPTAKRPASAPIAAAPRTPPPAASRPGGPGLGDELHRRAAAPGAPRARARSCGGGGSSAAAAQEASGSPRRGVARIAHDRVPLALRAASRPPGNAHARAAAGRRRAGGQLEERREVARRRSPARRARTPPGARSTCLEDIRERGAGAGAVELLLGAGRGIAGLLGLGDRHLPPPLPRAVRPRGDAERDAEEEGPLPPRLDGVELPRGDEEDLLERASASARGTPSRSIQPHPRRKCSVTSAWARASRDTVPATSAGGASVCLAHPPAPHPRGPLVLINWKMDPRAASRPSTSPRAARR